MTSHLLSLATASPRGVVSADRAVDLLCRLASEEVKPRVIEALHRRTEIDTRGSVIADAVGGQTFYQIDAKGQGPTTAARLEAYAAHAGSLAQDAASCALDAARAHGVEPSHITHVVTASCTGFDAPGVDQHLMTTLGLSREVRRTHVGFMGCHAAINALAAAAAFAESRPGARVLVCCVELCSLHLHYGPRTDRVVANALFADGAAAAVIGVKGASTGSMSASGSLPALTHFAASVFPGTADAMAWTIGDHGFEMTLSPRVPDLLRESLPGWVGAVLDAAGLRLADVGGWAIHPGGPRLVRTVLEALRLPEELGEPSLHVLRNHGNMSSPTVLFILEELRRRHVPRPWVALAFGPGLAGEAMVVR